MSAFVLSLLLLAAPAPAQAAPKGTLQAAPPPAGAPVNPVAIAAQAVDRCMATFAVRLTSSKLTDDTIYTVADIMCQPAFDELAARINATLPKAKADELVARLTTQRRSAFDRLLKTVRDERAAGKLK